MSAIPQFTMRELLDAGVHFGHKTLRWNPKMAPFLFGVRNDIHIINLQITVPMLHQALKAVHDVAAKNGRILFVGTKRQASEILAEEAKRCGQYYINHRWLGGALTNWGTISQSIKTLRKYEELLNDEESGITKKERLKLAREQEKLEKSLGGIKDMGGTPDLLFIVDTNKEDIAVKEATKLGIPIVAIVDSNSNPDGITYPIPGNDDATRAIKLYCQLVSDAALSGIQASMAASGVDLGASSGGVKDNDLEKAFTGKPSFKKAKKSEAETELDEKLAEDEKPKGQSKPAAKGREETKGKGQANRKAPAKQPEVVKKKTAPGKAK